MCWIAVLILGISFIGLYPRLFCLPHAWVALSFSTGAELIEGGDQLNAIICLILAPLLLVDSRRFHWSYLNEISPMQSLTGYFSWALFRFQVAFVYFEAGVQKTRVAEWSDGTALFYFMNDPVFGLPIFLRPLFSFVFDHGVLLTVMTWCIIGFEILLAASLFMHRKWWKFLIVPALLMHFAIVYVHGLGTFFITMAAALVGYLVAWDQQLEFKFPQFKQKQALKIFRVEE